MYLALTSVDIKSIDGKNISDSADTNQKWTNGIQFFIKIKYFGLQVLFLAAKIFCLRSFILGTVRHKKLSSWKKKKETKNNKQTYKQTQRIAQKLIFCSWEENTEENAYITEDENTSICCFERKSYTLDSKVYLWCAPSDNFHFCSSLSSFSLNKRKLFVPKSLPVYSVVHRKENPTYHEIKGQFWKVQKRHIFKEKGNLNSAVTYDIELSILGFFFV